MLFSTKYHGKYSIALALFAVTLPMAACGYEGELGNLDFELGIADSILEFESGGRVLVGTHLCPALVNHTWTADEKILACYDETVTGPAKFDAERCWTLDTPGEVVWELTPNNACPLADHNEFAPDRIRVEVVDPSDQLRLGFDDWRVRGPTHPGLVDDNVAVVGLAAGRTLADLRESPSAARRVVAGQVDVPTLRLDDALGRIWFVDAGDPSSESNEGLFELVGDGASIVEPDPSSGEVRKPGERPLVLELGAVARVRASLPGGELLESPELIAVSASDAASLDLMVMLTDGAPFAAFAEVRDAQGRVLHAPAIEWSVVEGAIAVRAGTLGTEARTREYAELQGRCEAPSMIGPAEHRAVLRARFGELEDTVELVWNNGNKGGSIGPDSQEPFVPDEDCMFGSEPGDGDPSVDSAGCACSSADDQPSAPGWFGFAVLLALLPRRRGRGRDR